MTATVTGGPTPDLSTYDIVLVNSSAGKDSQASLDVVAEAARAAGVLDRVVVVHVCLQVRPGTLGFQLCWREDHHHGDHKSQDGQTWSDQ